MLNGFQLHSHGHWAYPFVFEIGLVHFSSLWANRRATGTPLSVVHKTLNVISIEHFTIVCNHSKTLAIYLLDFLPGSLMDGYVRPSLEC